MALDLSVCGFAPDEFSYDNLDTGGSPEPGIYRARLIKEEFSDPGDKTPSQNLTFQILGGGVAGQTGKQITLYLPASSDDGDKLKNMVRRILGIGKRLGIYPEELAKKLAPVPFELAVDKDCVIEVEEHIYEDRNTGEKKSTNRISYMGVWHAGHPDAPDCPKEPSKKPNSPASSGKSEPAKNGTAKGGGKPATTGKPSAASVTTI